jgi:hypothetical protein
VTQSSTLMVKSFNGPTWIRVTSGGNVLHQPGTVAAPVAKPRGGNVYGGSNGESVFVVGER